MNELRVILVCDKKGHDDEGMKKISRKLHSSLQEISGIEANTLSNIEVFKEDKGIDIIHFLAGPTYRTVLLSALCKKRNNSLCTVLTFNNPKWGIFANFAIRVFKPDHIIVSSKKWQEWAQRSSLPFSFFSVSGVDLLKYQPASETRIKQIRQKLNIPMNKIIVLHVGHLKYDRNLEVLKDVQSHPDFQVVIIGSTSTQHSSSLVHHLKKNNCIVTMKYIPHIEEFYQSADCYLFPTINPSAAVQIPLSILEAMATNIPVLTTCFGGLQSFIPNSNGIKYVSPNQFGDLPLIIKTIISRPSETRSLVRGFNWNFIAKQLNKLYINLINQ
jgi:glycosyltransferase involved in cell wall biosynthesis